MTKLFPGGKPRRKDIITYHLKKGKDGYIKAFAACSLYNVNRVEEAREIAKELAEVHQDKESGRVVDAKATITMSRGISKDVEATAGSILCWLKDENSSTFAYNISQALQFLYSKCQGGRFGSTQSTLLALKAIV